MNIDELKIIAKSNTLFSTMMCKNCETPLYFAAGGNKLVCLCDKCGYTVWLSLDEISALLNYNGINSIITLNHQAK